MSKLTNIILLATLLFGATTSVAADTLADIKKSGVFKIAYRDDIPPFSSLDENGSPQGFSIDLCNIIAKKVRERVGASDLKIEYVRVTALNRLEAVEKGDAHIECGATTTTFSRQEIVDFSNLIYMSGTNLLTTKKARVGEINDLQNKRVAAVANTTTLDVLRQRFAEHNLNIELDIVDDHHAAMQLLEKGKVAAIGGDQATLLGLIFTSPKQKSLRLTADLLSYEPYAFPVRRNDADFRLVVNRALSDIYYRGQIGKIWEQWFGEYGVRPTRLLLTLYQLNSLQD